MATQQEREIILNYIAVVLQLDGPEEDAQDLRDKLIAGMSVRTPRQLFNYTKETMKDFLDDNTIDKMQYTRLREFQAWMQFYVNSDGRNGRASSLPKTLDEWHDAFDVDGFETFIHSELFELTTASMATADNDNKSRTSNRTSGSKSTQQPPKEVDAPKDDNSKASDLSGDSDSEDSKKSKPKRIQHSKAIKPFMKTSMTEFPEFTGRHQDWKAFKRGVKAIMELHGLGHLLTIKSDSDVECHKLTMKVDDDYKVKVKQFHSVLSLRLAKGSASTWISKYEDEMDGVLAWRDLSKYYSHGGNKEILITNIVNELTSLQLRHDSNGGFQKYLVNFEDKIRDLSQLDFDIPDPLKKTYFLNGIVDRDYDTTKDMCEKLTYKETIDTIRSKAIKLGKVDSKNHSNSNNRSTRSNNRDNNNNSNSSNSRGRGRRRRRYRDRDSDNQDQRQNNNRSTNSGRDGRDSNDRKYNRGAKFSDEVWAKMSDENKKWILAAKNQSQKKYGMQYNNEGSNSSTKRVTFSNNVSTYEQHENEPNPSPGNNTNSSNDNQSSGNNNKPPQSIFRRQKMVKTTTTSPGKDGLQSPPLTAYDESKPMDPIEYLSDPPGQAKDGFFIDSIEVMTRCPPSFEVLFRIIEEDGCQKYYITNAKWMQCYHPEAFANHLLMNYTPSEYAPNSPMRSIIQWAYNYLDVDAFDEPKKTIHQNLKKRAPTDVSNNTEDDSSVDLPDLEEHQIYESSSDEASFYDSSSDEASYSSVEPSLDGQDDDSTTTTNSEIENLSTTTPSQDGPTPTQPTPAMIEFKTANPVATDTNRATNNRFTFVPRGALPTVRQDPTRLFSRQKTDDGYYLMYTDSGADTSSIGGPAWHIDQLSGRFVNVAGYDEGATTLRQDVEIGSGVTAVDLPPPVDETILVRVNEATIMDDCNSLLSSFQAREAMTIVDDIATKHGGGSLIAVDDYVLPLEVRGGLMSLKIRKPTPDELRECTMVELTSPDPWHPEFMTDKHITTEDYAQMLKTFETRHNNLKRAAPTKPNFERAEQYFLCPSKEVVEKTLENTTAVGTINTRFPMRQHYQSRNPLLQRRRFLEGYATDTWFSTVTSYEGFNCCQHFVGLQSYCEHVYGMVRESDGPQALLDFFRQEGVPVTLVRDNSRMQQSKEWNEYLRRYWVKDGFTEPGHPNQNPAETDIRSHKEMLTRLFILTGCDPKAWFKASAHVCDIRNHLARQNLNWRTPLETRDGETPDISGLLKHQFWDLVYYYDLDARTNDPGGNEKLGRWCGRAKNYGDKMCYWILDVDTHQFIVRSMVRSVEDVRPNLHFAERIQEELAADEARKQDESNNPLIIHEPGDKVVNENGEVEVKNTPHKIQPADLLDLNLWDKFLTKGGKQREFKGTVAEQIDDNKFRVEFANGKQRVYEYEDLIAKLNRPEEDGAEYWEYESILDHRWSKDPNRKGRLDVLIKWAGYEEPTWEPMEVIKKDDPVTLAQYADEKNLTDTPTWEWAKQYLRNRKQWNRLLKQAHLNKKRTGRAIKYQFGVKIPRTVAEAYAFDKENGNTKWADSIGQEVHLLKNVYPCFKIPDNPNEITEEYQRIPLLWVFAVKFDGRHRSRCVGGGHVTDDIANDYYSGVVDLETARIAFLAAILYGLQVIAGDISSAYLQSFTIEKIYTIPGEEFQELAGIKVIVIRALYGLRLSGAAWHQKLSDDLRAMGFTPSKADYDLWMRARGDHYEYIAVIVDDLLIFSKYPDQIIGPLQDVCKYELKGVGVPEYYSGADVRYNQEERSWEWMSKTYVSGLIDRIQKLFGHELRGHSSPLDANDHPELDDTDLLVGSDVQIYQMLVGSAQWAVTLGRFDIQYATNTLARYNTRPREGHLRRMMRVFGYLKTHNRYRIKLDPTDPCYDDFNFVENDWTGLYPDAEEDVDPDAPPPLSDKELRVTIYVDASHASDLETRRSVSAHLVFLGRTPVSWYSKRQNTVETSTYSSELVSFRIAVDKALAIRYQLRAMGLKVTQPVVMLCDSQSVCCNMQLPSSGLKKKHQAVAWHRCREAVAMGIVLVAYVSTMWNLADIGTKPLNGQDFFRLLMEVYLGKSH